MSAWTGVLELEVEKRSGVTWTKRLYCQGAFKIMRPVYLQKGQPCYYILNPGGGYLDGDKYQMKVHVNNNASATLTTQSATKIYKTPQQAAYQETTFILKRGSYLEFLPDPLIAYEDAQYVQKNIVHMEQGASFLYSDIVTPGWSPEGKHFSYQCVRLLNKVYMENELIVFDHLRLTPQDASLVGLGRMEGYTHLGSFIVISEKVDEHLLDQVYEVIFQYAGNVKVGLSKLIVPGLTIRVMANTTQDIERIFTRCHKVICAEGFNKEVPLLRKY